MTYANNYVFLWYFIMCFCGIMLRVFVVTTECDWRMWRVKWYIQPAGSVVFTMLPA